MSLFSANRLLVPIDFSEESFQVQELTLDFVKDPSNLDILHVLSRLNPGDPGVIWNAIDDETRKQHVQKVFQERFSEQKYKGINFSVVIGDPSSEIIDYAKKQQIDLIVMPSHGRTGLGQFFLGSVTEKVIRSAHCPVLVVPRDYLLNR